MNTKSIPIQSFLDRLNALIGNSDNDVCAVVTEDGKIGFQIGCDISDVDNYIETLVDQINFNN